MYNNYFDKLNRDTWRHNNIGNQHHHTNTGIKHPTNFDNLNKQTYSSNNKITVAELYASDYKSKLYK